MELQEVELFIEDETEDGVFAVSLVENPAIEENFIALSGYKMELKVVDDEKRIVTGLALVPEKRIYRRIKEKEFNIYFSKETIYKTAELFMKKLNLNNVTSEHERPVKGVSVIESWIVEYPNNINVVPIDSCRFHTPVSFNGIPTLATSIPYDKQQENTTENMQRMPASHSKENAGFNTVTDVPT